MNVLQMEAHEETVILVGHNTAGELIVDSDFPQPVVLPASIYPGISGYATGELGLHSTVLDDPTEDLFQLSTATDFRMILLAKDSGMEVWNDSGSGYMATNELFYVGPSPFDTHPVWNLVNGISGHAYSLTLKLRDLNGVYPDSAPFVLSFTPEQIRYPLSIKPIDSLHSMVSWPTNATGLELQSSASLAADWSTVTNGLSVAGTNFTFSTTNIETQQFFRLYRP